MIYYENIKHSKIIFKIATIGLIYNQAFLFMTFGTMLYRIDEKIVREKNANKK